MVTPLITIVDYNAGNLRSVKRACDAVGIESQFTQDPDAVAKADKIIFPGVGHARSAMDTLLRTGLADALRTAHARGVPILGICVGAQLVLDSSEEGETPGFGFLPGRTRLFRLEDPALKIPHIGWNTVQIEQPHPLLETMKTGDELYFVHSYYLDPAKPEHVFATSDHGPRFCVALGKDNLFATQFHPEKSGRLGLGLLARFARWNGTPC
ncbi:MAG TPA: imidazole glycerol phosphate synthase subunit HisH [Polyangiales bacterium]|jgi:glutamine amidotransferase|nr:imidazole glycerol phosphate synthase subunit HisH [Polyangiales bacterium]